MEYIASIIRVQCAFFVVTANFVPTSPILDTLMMEALRFSETSILTRAIGCTIPEDDILHSHRRENLKSYTALTGWALQRRRNVFLVIYELGFLPSHCRDSLKSIILNYRTTLYETPSWRLSPSQRYCL
jgi:hypothetical protein